MIIEHLPVTTHPQITAKIIAEALRRDPIAASQVHEFIPESELLNLLGITEVSIPDAYSPTHSVIVHELEQVIADLEQKVDNLKQENADLAQKLSGL